MATVTLVDVLQKKLRDKLIIWQPECFDRLIALQFYEIMHINTMIGKEMNSDRKTAIIVL